MKRLVISTLVCVLFSTAAANAQNPLKGMWPFGKNKSTQTISSNRSVPKRKVGIPSPGKWLDQAEKSTNAVFKSARNSLSSVKELGKSMNGLNPFAGNKANSQPKQKKSLLDTFFPKQPKDDTPLTMSDFMKLKRPSY